MTLERVKVNKRVLTLGKVNRRVIWRRTTTETEAGCECKRLLWRSGHWQRDCHKTRADQQQQVRQVGEVNDAKHETSVSNASVSTGSGSHAVRLLSAQPCNSSIGHFENLTIHSVLTYPSSSPHGLRVLSDLREFDMAVDLRSLNHHVRVVSSMDYMESAMGECDVIVDSGVDTNALPLCFDDVGIAGPAPDTCFVDAQGAFLNVQATRVANIRFGTPDIPFLRASLPPQDPHGTPSPTSTWPASTNPIPEHSTPPTSATPSSPPHDAPPLGHIDHDNPNRHRLPHRIHASLP